MCEVPRAVCVEVIRNAQTSELRRRRGFLARDVLHLGQYKLTADDISYIAPLVAREGLILRRKRGCPGHTVYPAPAYTVNGW